MRTANGDIVLQIPAVKTRSTLLEICFKVVSTPSKGKYKDKIKCSLDRDAKILVPLFRGYGGGRQGRLNLESFHL